jgi:hypothetical protein
MRARENLKENLVWRALRRDCRAFVFAAVGIAGAGSRVKVCAHGAEGGKPWPLVPDGGVPCMGIGCFPARMHRSATNASGRWFWSMPYTLLIPKEVESRRVESRWIRLLGHPKSPPAVTRREGGANAH